MQSASFSTKAPRLPPGLQEAQTAREGRAGSPCARSSRRLGTRPIVRTKPLRSSAAAEERVCRCGSCVDCRAGSSRPAGWDDRKSGSVSYDFRFPRNRVLELQLSVSIALRPRKKERGDRLMLETSLSRGVQFFCRQQGWVPHGLDVKVLESLRPYGLLL